jgi:hypothetical protein
MSYFEKIKIDTSDVQQKFNKLSKALSDPSGVFSKTIGDMQRRAPGKVADAVREVFSIKKADVMPTKKKTDLKKAGTIKITGQTIAELTLNYEGRVLTPLHFGVTPKTQPKRGKKYSVKLKVKKQQKAVKSPTKEGKVPFVAPARKGSSRIIPWLRDSDGVINPMKTLSLPQMVDNEQARNVMNQSLGELLHSRFNHHLKRYLGENTK